ncbi:MAG TPA: hypothetical protein ENH10_05380 [Bacteroidetes bacterium]|nr:glyoxalase-like domain protein [bacterium BMS3Bbin04]HDO65450.1 hypothetical protein [Bacteroidota bacterium]HEX04575.1 hypothetical protein [Bacteroidota bacterium]
MADKVVWYEILGKNGDNLQKFYGGLFGWQFNNEAMPGYGMTDEKDTGIGGGVGTAPDGTIWSIFYVGVDDIDATIEKVTSNGGLIVMPKMTVPDGPTLAVFTDPEGNKVGLVQNQEM